MAESYNLLATPNPEEHVLAVDVPVIAWRPKLAKQYLSKLKDFKGIIKDRIPSDYNDYVYVDSADTRTPGHLTLLFAAPKPNDLEPEMLLEPYASQWVDAVYDWPTVLKGLFLVNTPGTPLRYWNPDTSAYELTPRRYMKPLLREGGKISSKCLKEKFLSNRPLPAGMITTNEPSPTRVAWQGIGLSPGSLVCLHDDVRMNLQTEVLEKSLMSNTRYGYVDVDFFPKTNMTDWTSFIWKVETVQRAGVHYYERFTLFPPGRKLART